MNSKKSPYTDFKELKVQAGFAVGFSVRIFYKQIKLTAKWTDFFRPIIDSSEADFFAELGHHKSFVGFIFKDKELFAFSGGLGSHVIRDYIDDDFGLAVLTRLLGKSDVKLKRIVNRALAGNELASDRVFKADYRIANEDNFGKIYRSLSTHLTKEVLKNNFGLNERTNDRGSSAIARSSFQIGRSISADELLKIVDRIETILKNKPLFELNNIRQISGRNIGDKELIAELNAKLVHEVFLAFKHDHLSKFEIFHREVERFLEATEFHLRRGSYYIPESVDGLGNLSMNRIFDLLSTDKYFLSEVSLIDPDDIDLNTPAGQNSVSDLLEVLQKFRIEGENQDSELVTSGSLLDHIQGEIDNDGAKHFRLDGSWYRATDGFIKDVDSECSDLISQTIITDLLPEPWHHKRDDENSYIEKYFDKKYDKTIFPLHRVIHDQTELCDLLIKKDDAVYFVHIKQGFDASVRDLISQIYLSARLFISASKDDNKWEDKSIVKGYFKKIKSYNGNSTYGEKFRTKYKTMREQSFANIFSGVQSFNFVFAVYDNASSLRELPKDLANFNSTIAKMSLINLDRDIARISRRSSSLKFVQIKRE